MILDKTSERLSSRARKILVVSIGNLESLCSSNFVLGEMHIHFISIEIGVVGVAVGVVHANRFFTRQDTNSVTHDRRLVECRLSVHQDDITVGKMSVNLLVAGTSSVAACGSEELISQRHTVVNRLVAKVDNLAIFVFDRESTGPFVNTINNCLLHVSEVVACDGLRVCQLLRKDGRHTNFVSFDIGIGGVGKEQDFIGNPHLLQLRRSVSRALGKNAEEDMERAHGALASDVPMLPTHVTKVRVCAIVISV
jgi:hypothetical protein